MLKQGLSAQSVYTYMCMSIHTCTCADMTVHMCVCIHTHTHTHTYTYTQRTWEVGWRSSSVEQSGLNVSVQTDACSVSAFLRKDSEEVS